MAAAMESDASSQIIIESIGSRKPRFIGTRKRWDGDFLIVSSQDGSLHFLNNTAGIILEAADGTMTLADICNALKADYPEVPPQTLVDDIVDSVRQMQWKRIISLL